MRVFLTGATGVIGRRVVPLLIGKGHAVTAVGRSPEKRSALARQGTTPVSVDLFAPEAVRRAVAGHDAVVNLATHMPPSTLQMFLRRAWRENDRIRSIASGILVDAALAEGVPRFIQESFAGIYEDGGEEWIDEQAPVRPAPYNRSTLDAERAAERFTRSGGTGIVLRFAGFYGPDARHVLDMIRFVQKGWAPMPGSPEAFISSVSHDDAASAMVAALNVQAGTYNVVDDEPLRRRAYFDVMADALGIKSPKLPPPWLVHFAGSLGETLARSLRLSNRKLRAETGWAPKYPSVREGWPAMLAQRDGTTG